MENSILQEEQGKYWTNGKTIGKEVYLGINDSPSNWLKITEEEKEQLEKEMLNSSEELGVDSSDFEEINE